MTERDQPCDATALRRLVLSHGRDLARQQAEVIALVRLNVQLGEALIHLQALAKQAEASGKRD